MSNIAITLEKKKEELSSKLSALEINRKTEDAHALSCTVPEGNKSGCNNNVVCALVTNTSDSEAESFIDQQWKGFKPGSGNVNNTKRKHPTSQRMKLKEQNIIANNKANAKPPSYYKFDRTTTLMLQMFINQKHLGEFHNIVGKGINSVVIHAHCYGKYHIYFPCGNAVKVYKTSNSIEKNIAIYKRVQRENEHLLILRDQHFSNNAPHPVQMNKNVIIMSFIGSDQETAPSISALPHATIHDMYQEIMKEIDTWYKKLGLIHGNLSASTIVYWMDKLYFIGWSHSVRRDHHKALKKLMQDCHFVFTFFQSRGVSVRSAEEWFKAITGLDKISSKVLEVVHKDLWKDPHVPNPNRTGLSNCRSIRDRFK